MSYEEYMYMERNLYRNKAHKYWNVTITKKRYHKS